MSRKKIDRRKKMPSIRTLIEFLEKKIVDLYEDIDKFDNKGNGSAGVRVRIELQEISYQIKEVRQEILIRKKRKEMKKRKEKNHEGKNNRTSQ